MGREWRITIKVSEGLHKSVRMKAAEQGRPISEIVRKLLELWVTGGIDLRFDD